MRCYSVTATFQETPLVQALNVVFEAHELTWRLYQDDGILLFRRLPEKMEKLSETPGIVVVGNLLNAGRYKTARLKGRITDGATEETLAGVVVYEPRLQKGTSSDTDGFFET